MVPGSWGRRSKITVDELLKIIPGPDFPTGGLIYRYRDEGDGSPTDCIRQAYETGRGLLVMQAHVGLEAVDAIAVTRGPGLAGSLVVGMAMAKGMALASGLPLIGVNHLEAHLYSIWLVEDEPEPAFPLLALIVSGGHSELVLMRDHLVYERLGGTLDDAAGEAFDKTAQLLGLGYPGGPALSKLADGGHPYRFKLPRPPPNSGDLEFSFSGLKTAVLTLVKKEGLENKADIAAGFQAAVVDVLAGKCLAALKQTGLKRLVVAGGVGANRALRARLDAEMAQRHLTVFYPPLELCTDNGAMIAYAGALRLARDAAADGRFGVRPRWELSSLEAA